MASAAVRSKAVVDSLFIVVPTVCRCFVFGGLYLVVCIWWFVFGPCVVMQ